MSAAVRRLLLSVCLLLAPLAIADAATVSLAWDASSSPLVAGYRLEYGTSPGVYTASVDAGNHLSWPLVLAEGQVYYVVVRGYDASGVLSPPSNEIVVSTLLPSTPLAGSAAAARFVALDSTTQGNWRGVYGREGYLVVNDATSLPPYSTVSPAGNAAWLWDAAPVSVRALQRASGSNRIAATWYAGARLSIDVNITDGATHQVALYALDWDSAGRTERIDVIDVATGAALDSRLLGGFADGQYVVWEVKGRVRFDIVRTGALNAVVSAVFVDPVIPAAAPTVTLTAPANGATFTAPATISVAAAAQDSDGTVRQVDFYTDATLIGTDATAPFAATVTNVPAGTYRFTAVATDNSGLTSTSPPVTISVAAPGSGSSATASATFVRTDTTTQGNWRGVYGRDGYAVANDATALPSYATLSTIAAAAWTWDAAPASVRALQRASGTGRIAAAWYSGERFSFDVNLTDGQSHEVALYTLDWDSAGRTERIDVIDVATGVALDSRPLSSFTGGQYAVWSVRGRVRFDVIRTGPLNAVVSAVFLDPAGAAGAASASTSASFVRLDTTTQGNWLGLYGGEGYAIVNDATVLPSYATVSPNGAAWMWDASPSPASVRALQRASGKGRIAAAWYAGERLSIEVNITDGRAHQVALYGLDWDTAGRSERIDVIDVATGATLDTRLLSAFAGGQYAVWSVRGRVRFDIVRTGLLNAVVSAVFLDPAQ